DAQERLARPDTVAVLQVRRRDLRAVDVGPVAAAEVHHPATGRVGLDQEVQAREVPVLDRQSKVGPLRPADDKGVMADEGENAALVRAGRRGEGDTHDATVPRIAHLPVGTGDTRLCHESPLSSSANRTGRRVPLACGETGGRRAARAGGAAARAADGRATAPPLAARAGP